MKNILGVFISNILFSPDRIELSKVEDNQSNVTIPNPPRSELDLRIAFTSLIVPFSKSVVVLLGGSMLLRASIIVTVITSAPKSKLKTYTPTSSKGIRYNKILNAIPADIRYK